MRREEVAPALERIRERLIKALDRLPPPCVDCPMLPECPISDDNWPSIDCSRLREYVEARHLIERSIEELWRLSCMLKDRE